MLLLNKIKLTMESTTRVFVYLAKRLELVLKILDYYDYMDKSYTLWRRISSDTRKQALEDEDVFRAQLKNKRKFAIYNFDAKVKTLLMRKDYMLLKYFEIDMYLDSRSRVTSFYEFLVDLKENKYEGLTLNDLNIFSDLYGQA